MNDDQEPLAQAIPVPSELYSSDTGKPLDRCLMCNAHLLEDGVLYMVEKSIKQHPEMQLKEPIFEYAMCMTCAIQMNESLSEESRQRIGAYFAKHANLAGRSEALLNQERSLKPWIERCAIKGTLISEAREYQVVAQCEGKNLVFGYMPFALSIEAMEEMSELLSAKSRGEMDDFIGRYFSGPPEVAELLKKKFVLV